MTGTSTGSPPSSLLRAGLPDGPRLVSRRPRRRRLWLVGAALLAAFAFLMVEGLGSSLNYFDTVDQALAHRGSLGTTTFRLEGTVVPGTIRSTSVGTNFRISEGDHVVQVANTGSPPQLFQSGIPVVVVGHFVSATSDDFVSNSILVKHSANYIARYPGRVKAKNGSTR
ncbi:MAG TPA: cytochrome c maturation protein CcmE [Acidimicrobiales bacterium]|nr:cytochrome c maturation protein CcmE [Acidimicrobiales bacterium]